MNGPVRIYTSCGSRRVTHVNICRPPVNKIKRALRIDTYVTCVWVLLAYSRSADCR